MIKKITSKELVDFAVRADQRVKRKQKDQQISGSCQTDLKAKEYKGDDDTRKEARRTGGTMVHRSHQDYCVVKISFDT